MVIGVDGLLKRDDVLPPPPIPLTIRDDCGVKGRCCVELFEGIGRVIEELSSSSSLDAA
jgi:hypothetical protein